MNYITERPLAADIKGIYTLLMEGASAGQLLPRPLSELYKRIRDFYIIKDQDGKIAGCCALAIVWDNIAEIRSLYVTPKFRRIGLGRILAEACFADALNLGINRIFTLTYQQEFFSQLGFAVVGKDTLPQKVWGDCIHCPKFPDCDEIAMERILDAV